MKEIVLTGNDLTLEDVVSVGREYTPVALSEASKEKIRASRKTVEDLVASGKKVYGVTTGFSAAGETQLDPEECHVLQRNLILSHAVGAGDPFPEDVVRAIMLLRVNNMAKGYSGCRLMIAETLIEMLNRRVTPFVPEKGSLGASGDLCPLAHMVLPMIGLGEAWYQGHKMSGSEAMKAAGIPMIELTYKEGLSLINGTQVMTAVGALTLYDTIQIMKTADIALAMSFEANRGVIDALDPRLHELRPHIGQKETAEILRTLLQGSKNVTRQGEIRVQDGYALRCAPIVHGASRDAMRYAKKRVETEMNSVTDNPIIYADDDEAISGGNFHGQPMALAFDFLGIALAELADISERRIERLVNPSIGGFPAFLVENGGLNSGFMIVQYSAAALVSENKVLAHPAAVDSIPSSANQEDHVSMGTIAARKAGTIMRHVRRVLAMELMCGCQAVDLLGNLGWGPDCLGPGTRAAYEVIREKCPKLVEDRPLYEDINHCEETITSERLIHRVEEAVGVIGSL